jgi:lipoyl(octanoyl) transferase
MKYAILGGDQHGSSGGTGMSQIFEFRIRRKLPPPPQLTMHLCGDVRFNDLVNLQRRIAYEAASREDGQITLFSAEHEPLVSLGRSGLRSEILLSQEEITAQDLELEPVARGGGCIPHGPGQLAILAVVPLQRLKWSVGGYLHRLQSATLNLLEQLQVASATRSLQFGIWGKSGQLAAFGVAVRHGVATFGLYLNVAGPAELCKKVLTSPGDIHPHMGWLLSERASAGKIEQVRNLLPPCFGLALDCPHPEVLSGHPLLPALTVDCRERTVA